MAERSIGLDIGTHAVRAADVRIADVPDLRVFGQVGLPRGAVDHGEVVDPGAVAASIRRLWRETRLRSRRVRVGVASLRTIVRQVEMPAMAPEELRSAIEFQAGEFIPLPPEDTILDFQVLESFASADGEPLVRVLIAAAHREMLENVLAAVREAGLQTVALDLVPFALVRSLAGAGGGDTGPGAATIVSISDDATDEVPVARAEGIVSVGAGVTVVVVHEDRVPRFVRIVASGGDDLTAAVEESLGIPFEEAELLKRRLGVDEDRADEVRTAIERPLADLVNEVRGSLDFYTQQPEARPLSRVLLTGGGTLLDGFVERVGSTLAVPVGLAQPRTLLRVGDIGFPPDDLPALDPYLPVPVGLALGGVRDGGRISLLPYRERRVVESQRLALVGVAGLAALLAALGLLSQGRLNDIDDEQEALERQEEINRQLQLEIASFGDAEQLQTQVDQDRQLLAQALSTDVSWSRMLQEIARVIPGDVWLTSFSGTIGGDAEAGDAEAPAAGIDVISGAATFSAEGIDYPSAAAWLQRLATIASFDSPWVTSASRGGTGSTDDASGGIPVLTFSASAGITPEARSERSRLAREQAGIEDPSAAGADGAP